MGFHADALVHIGTHGTHEWLPGKEAGLGPDDYPEALIMDVPNIYPYIVDNVGEGLQAKRRGQAVIIDHMTPPFDKASLNPELRDLKSGISKYYDQKSKSPISSMAQFRDLVLRIKTLGLDKDLKLDTITDQNLEDIDDYLKEIEENKTLSACTLSVYPLMRLIRKRQRKLLYQCKRFDGKRFGTFQGAGTKEYRKIGERRIGCFYPGFEWKVCPGRNRKRPDPESGCSAYR